MIDGERKHELCRYGALSEAYVIDAATSAEAMACVPTCGWRPETFDIPPFLMRRVGQTCEFDRDCGPCACFSPLDDGLAVPNPLEANALYRNPGVVRTPLRRSAMIDGDRIAAAAAGKPLLRALGLGMLIGFVLAWFL